MKLEKALELKERYYKGGEIPSHSDYREADRLSIEAMKAWSEARKDPDFTIAPYLPGETDE